ncbi:MAG: site-specific DNA-methyltransferase, partial [Bradyrhizobium sp.]
MNYRAAPGIIRDSIVQYLSAAESASLAEITQAIAANLGDVPPSSVRSYLNLNTPDLFERTSRGHYRLRVAKDHVANASVGVFYDIDRAKLVHTNCFDWLR